MHELGFARIRPRHRSNVATPEQIEEGFECIRKWIPQAVIFRAIISRVLSPRLRHLFSARLHRGIQTLCLHGHG